MALFLPRRWRRQPQYPVSIDWSNPCTNGLLFDLDPITRTDRIRAVTPVYNGATTAGCVNGLAARFVRASSQYISLGDPSLFDFGSSDFSIEILYSAYSRPTTANSFIFVGKDTTGAGARQIYAGVGVDADDQFELTWINGSTVTQQRTSGMPSYVGTPTHVIAQRVGNSVQFFVNGILLNSVAGTYHTGFADVVASTTEARIGSRLYPGAESYMDGTISVARVRRGSVSLDKANTLANNPWQILAQQRSISYFLPTAAGGTDTTLTPSAGSLTLTGFATTVGQSYERTPSVGTLTFTGYAASVAVGGDRTLTPGAGSLTLFGFAPFPTVDNNTYLTTGLGSLTLTGYAPTVTTPLNLIPGVGSVTLTGYAPTIGQTYSLTPGVGSAAFTGYAPTIGVGYSLQTGLGALTLTGYAPTLGRTYSMTPAVGALTLTGLQPTVTATGQSIWTNISASSTIWTNQSASSTTWTNLN